MINNQTIKRFTKLLKRTSVARIIAFLFFSFYAFTMIYALAWAFGASLKDPVEYFLSKRKILPQKWLFENYKEAFSLLRVGDSNIFSMIFNSLWLTFGQATISMITCSTTAFIIAKYEFKGRKLLYVISITSMMIPLYGSFASGFRLYMNIGFYDSPLILLASASGVGSMFLIMHSFYKGVSWEYAEAAKIDGANEFYIYVKIMLPIAFPAISAIYMVMLIGGWNDYTTSIYYLPSYPTLASGLHTYKTISSFNMNFPVYFAGIIMSCIPTFILFISFQEKIMNSITIGGLKG